MMMLDEAGVVINLAYLALLFSTFTRTLRWLRALLILAAVFFVVFGAIEGIVSIVVWNVIIGFLHLYRFVVDWRAQLSVRLTADEEALRDEYFPDLADFEFHLLWSLGEERRMVDEQLIAAGSEPESMAIVLDGQVEVRRDGDLVATLGPGALVGEMTFVSGGAASADVVAVGSVDVHHWDRRQLTSLDQAHPHTARSVEKLIARDLVAKSRQ